MKIDLYADIWPTMKPDMLSALASPGSKPEGWKRYKITVNIPDQAFTGIVDGQAPVEDVVEVDKDE